MLSIKMFLFQPRQQAKSISSGLEITFPEIKQTSKQQQTHLNLNLELRINTLSFPGDVY